MNQERPKSRLANGKPNPEYQRWRYAKLKAEGKLPKQKSRTPEQQREYRKKRKALGIDVDKYHKEWRKTEAGKASIKRWNESEKGKQARKRYRRKKRNSETPDQYADRILRDLERIENSSKQTATK